MPKAYVIAAETIMTRLASRSTDPQFLPRSHPSSRVLFRIVRSGGTTITAIESPMRDTTSARLLQE